MNNKGIDVEKLKALGLEELDGVSGGSANGGPDPLSAEEKRACEQAYRDLMSDKGAHLSLEDIVYYCSLIVRKVTYDPYIAAHVKKLM